MVPRPPWRPGCINMVRFFSSFCCFFPPLSVRFVPFPSVCFFFAPLVPFSPLSFFLIPVSLALLLPPLPAQTWETRLSKAMKKWTWRTSDLSHGWQGGHTTKRKRWNQRFGGAIRFTLFASFHRLFSDFCLLGWCFCVFVCVFFVFAFYCRWKTPAGNSSFTPFCFRIPRKLTDHAPCSLGNARKKSSLVVWAFSSWNSCGASSSKDWLGYVE